jgi:hypothetical protein
MCIHMCPSLYNQGQIAVSQITINFVTMVTQSRLSYMIKYVSCLCSHLFMCFIDFDEDAAAHMLTVKDHWANLFIVTH